MRVLLACSLGGAGHLGPLLPLADAAARRGDEVLLVVPPSVESHARQTGHPVAVGAEPPAAAVEAIRDRLVAAPVAEAVVLGDRDLFARLATDAMLPAMADICAGWRPDLILREPCEYASAVVAERAGIPYAHVAISMADIEASVATLVAPDLDRHAAGLGGRLRAAPYLTRFPASMDPSPWADTRRFAEPSARSHPPLPEWWAGSTPLVYLTLGSVTGGMGIAAAAYRTALDAVAGVEARVLLTVGRATDLEVLGPVPANVHVERWVAQPAVLAEAALVVSHGGSGTTFGALAAGVPVIVFPLFADQFTNGERVAASGAGLTVEPADGRPRRTFAPDDADALGAAVRTVLADGRYGERAVEIAAEMASSPTTDERLTALLRSRGRTRP